MVRGRGRGVGVVCALGGLAFVFAFAGTAAAQTGEKEVNGFVGGAPGTAGGHFLQPVDVTVLHGDASEGREGKIFVVEGLGRDSRVQRLDADGNFELAWGKDVVRREAAGDAGAGFEVCSRAADCKAGVAGDRPGELRRPSGIAVNGATGAVYVVDAGNARVQQFTLTGHFVRAWPLAVAGGGRFVRAPIAVAPSPPHDVFVGDGGANRVLQFDARGGFIRAWGWGVDTGAAAFETCSQASGCRAGRSAPGLLQPDRPWPRHLAVDAAGVVYASPYLGLLFDPAEVRAKIYRFRSDRAPDPPPAGRSLLSPLTTVGAIWGDDGTRNLTNGATLGLDVDPANGRLLAINNPFGTSKLDEVRAPGSRRPVVDVYDELPFLQNVNGIAAGDGIVLLASGKVRELTGTSTFTGCARDHAARDCHGLVALAAAGPPRAVLVPGVGGQGALVDPGGVATYRYEASRDGRRWRPLGRPRHVAGDGFEPVPPPTDGLVDGAAYKLRLVTTKRVVGGRESTISPEGVMIAPAPIRTTDPARTFAPLVSLHSRERDFPMSARHFVDWATLKWDQEGCPPSTLAVGAPRHRARLDDPELPPIDPARLGGRRAVPYRFRPRGGRCRPAPPGVFAANEHTRPNDPGRPRGLTGASGFYLDLASDELSGQRRIGVDRGQAVLGEAPVYVERLSARVGGRPALRIVYWLLYGYTAPPGDDANLRTHEGGWQRVSVLLRAVGRDRYAPVSVRYRAWGKSSDVPWEGVTRVDSAGRPARAGTHPLVLSALGSHALYSTPGVFEHLVHAGGPRHRLADRAAACRDCPQWRTWERLLLLRRQPWYGFGGGWGRVFGGTHTTGPLGPSPFRAGN